MPKKPKRSSVYDYLIYLVLGVAAFLRFFRIQSLLGFWYDQGRDALVIWDFIHHGKFFLIGPTTGIEGVFRGPWYYWLITPFYYLGQGNPVWPACFLILTSLLAIFILYKVGEEIGGRGVGLLSAFLASISVEIINSSRWLSNPTPMFLVGILLIWSLFKFLDGKKWSLPLIGFLLGMAMNFGSAMEVFYFPALLIIFIWKKKLLPNAKAIALSLVLFVVGFLPQIAFEARHPGVLIGPVYKFLFQEKSFSLTFWQLAQDRLPFYYSAISSKFWIDHGSFFAPFLVITGAFLWLKRKRLFKNAKFAAVLILAIAPFLGGFVFSGNNGTLYGYYFSGYYFVWILLFAYLLLTYWKKFLGKLIVALFLIFLVCFNAQTYFQGYIGPDAGLRIITLSEQTEAIDWIYKDAAGRDFNVDVYVPPVIPYAYDYLFKWLGTVKYNKLPLDSRVPLLYTLYESDSEHPDRINAWLERQKGIGGVIKSETFGDITVEQRLRFEK